MKSIIKSLLITVILLAAFLSADQKLLIAQESDVNSMPEAASTSENVSDDVQTSQAKGGGEKSITDKVKTFFNSLKNEVKWINIQNAFLGTFTGENIPKLLGIFLILTFIGYIPCYFAMGKIDVSLHPETVVSQFYKILIFNLFSSWSSAIYFTKDIFKIFNLFITIEFFLGIIYIFLIFEAFNLKSASNDDEE